MPTFGNTLFSELNGPTALVEQAVASEEAGFDFLVVSDHFHPWLSSHTDSPFIRYHPAIIAHAAATIQLLSAGRFTLGVGAGERLNEHVVGRGWPSVDIRHEMLTESIEAIRALFSGEMVTYRGDHITVEDAQLFSMPATPPPIAVAGSGPQSVELASQLGDAFIGTEPDAATLDAYRDRAGNGARTIGQVLRRCGDDRAR